MHFSKISCAPRHRECRDFNRPHSLNSRGAIANKPVESNSLAVNNLNLTWSPPVLKKTMIPHPPPGQGPIDPRGALMPPPPPGGVEALHRAAAAHPAPASPSQTEVAGIWSLPPELTPMAARPAIGRTLLLIILIVLLTLSLLLNIYLLMNKGRATGGTRASASSSIEHRGAN
jgi:hypothetical protein